jgi:DEAD/DEAH box helicase domain-containing protein
LQDVEQNSEHENDDTSGIIDCGKCNESHLNIDEDETVDGTGDGALAYQALHDLFSKKINQTDNASTHTNSVHASHSNTEIEAKKKKQSHWLPRQAAFAGSQPGRESRYGILSNETLKKIPVEALQLLNLDMNQQLLANGNNKRNSIDSYLSKNNRKLFLHQARAIEAAMNGVHTVVCTSTGSGKSMCFLLPVIAKALSSLQQTTDDRDKASASILIFPTKALAQDQLTKINAMLKSLPPQPDESKQLRAGVIDGDTPHPQRDTIASECQIILTNPDTLHAAILPNWKRPSYKSLLGRVSTVVVDEAHVYEGAFGAHVALVLAVRRSVVFSLVT